MFKKKTIMMYWQLSYTYNLKAPLCLILAPKYIILDKNLKVLKIVEGWDILFL